MKKTITIVLIALVAVGFGYFLFRISPQPVNTSLNDKDVKPVTQPSDLTAADHILGNPNAKNTMIIFEDLECPACANFNRQVTGKVPTELKDTKVVFRHFPLVQIHQNAVPAANALEAAGAQGKFWEFANAAYEKQTEWSNLADTLPYFEGIAKQVGVKDLEKFKTDVQNQAYKAKIESNYREGLALNLQGTPSVFFNGQKIELGDINSVKLQAEKLYK